MQISVREHLPIGADVDIAVVVELRCAHLTNDE